MQTVDQQQAEMAGARGTALGGQIARDRVDIAGGFGQRFDQVGLELQCRAEAGQQGDAARAESTRPDLAAAGAAHQRAGKGFGEVLGQGLQRVDTVTEEDRGHRLLAGHAFGELLTQFSHRLGGIRAGRPDHFDLDHAGHPAAPESCGYANPGAGKPSQTDSPRSSICRAAQCTHTRASPDWPNLACRRATCMPCAAPRRGGRRRPVCGHWLRARYA